MQQRKHRRLERDVLGMWRTHRIEPALRFAARPGKRRRELRNHARRISSGYRRVPAERYITAEGEECGRQLRVDFGNLTRASRVIARLRQRGQTRSDLRLPVIGSRETMRGRGAK